MYLSKIMAVWLYYPMKMFIYTKEIFNIKILSNFSYKKTLYICVFIIKWDVCDLLSFLQFPFSFLSFCYWFQKNVCNERRRLSPKFSQLTRLSRPVPSSSPSTKPPLVIFTFFWPDPFPIQPDPLSWPGPLLQQESFFIFFFWLYWWFCLSSHG